MFEVYRKRALVLVNTLFYKKKYMQRRQDMYLVCKEAQEKKTNSNAVCKYYIDVTTVD